MRLREITNMQAGTQEYFALPRRKKGQNGLKKCTFSCAIGADQRSAISAPEFDIGSKK